MKEEGFSTAEGGQGTTPQEEEFSSFASFERYTLSLSDVERQGDTPEAVAVLPLPGSLSLERGGIRFLREGDDLVIEAGSEVVVVEGYFTASPPPTLTTAAGGHFPSSLVNAFLQQGDSMPQKYAMGEVQKRIEERFGEEIGEKINKIFGRDNNEEIAEVVLMEGSAQVVRGGMRTSLKAGDSIWEGDIVTTGKGAEISIRFKDDAEILLGENAQFVIGEYAYEEAPTEGSQFFSLAQGAFAYKGGSIANADPTAVKLLTPMGEIGMGGGKTLGNVGDGDLSVTALEGRAVLSQNGHGVVSIDRSFEMLRVASKEEAQDAKLVSPSEVLLEHDFFDKMADLEAFLGKALIEGTEADDSQAGVGGKNSVVYEEGPLNEQEMVFLYDGGKRRGKDDRRKGDEDSFEFLINNPKNPDLLLEEPNTNNNDSDVTLVSVTGGEVRSASTEFEEFRGDDAFNTVSYASAPERVEIYLQSPEKNKGSFAEKDSFYSIEKIIGSRFSDTLRGDKDDNTFVGGAGDDTLVGGAGADTLEGSAGKDTLVGGAGADTLDGGDGTADTASYAGSLDSDGDGEGVSVDLSTGDGSGDDAAGDRLVAIENLVGTGRDDRLTGNDEGNILQGGVGADTLKGGEGSDRLQGGVGTDTLEGGEGSDTLQGGAGADTLEGGEDVDTLEGGAGADSYVFGSGYGADSIEGDADGGVLQFKDSIVSGRDDFTFSRVAGDVKLDAGGGSVTIKDTAGADDAYEHGRYSLSYGALGTEGDLGRFSLAEAGGESIRAADDDENDWMVGSANEDELYGNGGADILQGGAGVDTLVGGAGEDTLEGGADDDTLVGGAGADTLEGGADDDTLVGGAGADTLDGGDGTADTASYAGSLDSDGDGEGVTVDLSTGDGLGDDAAGDRLVAVENLIGTGRDDRLTGNDEGNILQGGVGADILKGGEGSDTLVGGVGADTLEGGEGSDTLEGGAGADTYVFGSGYGADSIEADADGGVLQFKDSIVSGRDDFTFSRADGDVKLDAGGGSVTIKDTAGADDAYEHGRYSLSYGVLGTEGELGRFSLAEAGGESIRATDDDEKDWIVGSANEDELYGNGGADILQGGAGVDTLEGGAGADILQGGAGIDTLEGGAGTDTLEGGADDDTLVGGAGADTLDGGDGTADTASYAGSLDSDGDGEGVSVDLSTGDGLGDDAAGDRLVAVENLVGTGRDDRLTGNDEGNILHGGAGADILKGGEGSDTLVGGVGVDTLEGGEGSDTLEGGAGADTYVFGSDYGADSIEADADGGVLQFKDSIVSGRDDVTFSRVAGDVKLDAGGGSVTIKDTAGADDAYGHGRYSLSYGVLGTEGDLGRFSLAEAGGESIRAADDDENDWIVGSANEDELYGNGGADILQGGAGVDTLVGGAGEDTLEGGADDDTLVGGAGADTLEGGADDDTLVGGAGADTLDGGDGTADTASYAGSLDSDGDGEGVSVDLSTGDGLGDDAAGDRLVAVENLVGTGRDDRLTGNDEGNILHGGAGADILKGGEGSDTLVGGVGADTLEGGEGSDTLEGGAGADTYVFGSDYGADSIEADADGGVLQFKDSIVSGRDDFTFSRVAGDVKLDAGGGSVTIKDTAGADDAYGHGRYSLSYGVLGTEGDLGRFSLAEAGGESIRAADDDENDWIVGSANEDELYGNGGADILQGGAGVDTLVGGAGEDTLEGGADDDTLVGGAGADTLEGGADDDTLVGGAGADTLDGGDGTADTASYAGSLDSDGDGEGVSVDLSTGDGSGDDAAGDRLVAVENLIGTGRDDRLTGNDEGNILQGGVGADILKGGEGSDTLVGGVGADTLEGGEGSDTLEGGAGADSYVFGSGYGADSIEGDADGGVLQFKDSIVSGRDDVTFSRADGDVKLDAGGGSVTIKDTAGADDAYEHGRYSLSYGALGTEGDLGRFSLAEAGGESIRAADDDENDWMVGSANEDALYGNGGADILQGGAGIDTLEGGAGTDTLEGGADDDTLVGGAGADTLDGGDGTGDTASYAGSLDSDGDGEGVSVDLSTGDGLGDDAAGDRLVAVENLIGTGRDDRLTGNDEGNILQGGVGADTLKGGKGSDTLVGGVGADTLEGGEGSDTLEGGAGADTYVFGSDYGADSIEGDADGGVLQFKDSIVSGRDDVTFSRVDGDVKLDAGGGSVTIKDTAGADDAYEHGRYSLSYGVLGTEGDLGRFSLAEAGGESIRATDDDEKDWIVGSANEDELYGNGGADILQGGAGVDTLEGGAGEDTLEGGADDDTLVGGAGADTLDGGDGTGDTASYAGSLDSDGDGEGVSVDLSTGDGLGDDAAGDRLVAVENLVGTGRDDRLTGNDEGNILQGGVGADTLEGGEGSDTLEGGAGADTYVFGSGYGADSIEADADGGVLQFKDSIVSGRDDFTFSRVAGDVKLDAGGGSVTIKDTAGADDAYGHGRYSLSYGVLGTEGELGRFSLAEAGGESIRATDDDENDWIVGSANEDKLYGNGGADILQGGAGVDTLEGGAGADTLEGGADDDLLAGGGGADTLDGGDGTGDTASYAGSLDSDGDGEGVSVDLSTGDGLGDDAAGDRLVAIENLIGTGRDDRLTGNDEGNILHGGAGADTFAGGEGSDTLEGGAGADSYVFGSGYGADSIEGDADGGVLQFKDSIVSGRDDVTFSRVDGDVKLDAGGGSVTIKDTAGADDAYEHGRYSFSYGALGTEGDLGRFSLAETGGESIRAADDDEKDWIVGSVNEDELYGNGGADILEGGAGVDILEGGEDDDILDGGEGADIYLFGNGYGADTIQGDTDGGVLQFKDSIVSGRDDFTFSRVEGDLKITTPADDSVTIANEVYQNGRYSVSYGVSGGEKELGRLSVAQTAGGTLIGGGGEDWLVGLVGDDILKGGAGADTLDGGAGVDTLEGGEGSDTLQGGEGADTYVFGSGYGADTIEADEDGGTLLFKDNIVAERSDFAFSRIDGNLKITTPDGNSVTIASDIFQNGRFGFSYEDSGVITALGRVSIAETEGAGLTGGEERDWLVGLEGENTLIGNGGADTIEGGEGADTLEGGEGEDILDGGEGADAYVFGRGYGEDTIQGDTDGGTLQFKDNIVAGSHDFIFSRVAGDVKIEVAGGSVTIKDTAGRDDAYGHGRYSLSYGEVGTETKLGRFSIAETEGESLTGGGEKDWLVGLAGGNTLIGNGGDDILEGGEGNDILDGGEGADTYVFGSGDGADTIQGDTDGGTLQFKDGSVLGQSDFVFSRVDGDVKIEAGGSGVTIKDTAGADDAYEHGRYSLSYKTGDTETDTGRFSLALAAGESVRAADDDGNDWMVGSANEDELYGNGGADILQGGAGADLLDGGEGTDDAASYAGSLDSDGDGEGVSVDLSTGDALGDDAAGDRLVAIENVIGTVRNDRLTGNDEENKLIGGAGEDTLEGGAGIDTLLGEADNDILEGGEGNDILDGGAGADTYVFGTGYGADTIQGNEDGGTLLFKDDIVSGRADFSFLPVDGNLKISTPDGNSVTIASEVFKNGHYSFSYEHLGVITELGRVSIARTEGEDLTGGEEKDWMVGLAGDNTIIGNGGADTLEGGTGADTLEGGEGADTLEGGTGADTLEGGEDADILDGGEGADIYLFGSDYGADTIQGDTDGGTLQFKDNVLSGRSDLAFSWVEGDLKITTPDGNSVTIANEVYQHGRFGFSYEVLGVETELGKASIAQTEGETLRGGEEKDWVVGLEGDNTLLGNGGADTLQGGEGNDILYGGAGADLLDGGGDNDILDGGEGVDHLDGGEGTDTVSYAGSSDTDRDGEGVVVDLSTGEGSGDDAEGDRLVAIENLIGTGRDDRLTGNDEENTLTGGLGDDTLDGGAGADTLEGGAGVDTYVFEEGDGADLIKGDQDGGKLFFRSVDDPDLLIVNRESNGDVTITVGKRNIDGDIEITENSDSVKIEQSAYADGRYTAFYGSADTEIGKLYLGTTGEDDFTGSADQVWSVGLAGEDTMSYAASLDTDRNRAGVNVDLSTGEGLGDHAEGDKLVSIENLVGTRWKDTLTGNSEDNKLTGGSGHDTLVGGLGIDTLNADAGNDYLYGGEGDDILSGGAGRQDQYIFEAASGNDIIESDRDGGKLIFKSFQDIYKNGFIIDRESDGDVKIMIGEYDSDGVLISTEDSDSVTIKQGAYANGRYTVFYGVNGIPLGKLSIVKDGEDTLTGSDAAELLVSLGGDDTLRGEGGWDALQGGEGEDTLYGGEGDDLLYGGADDDKLYGGTGADILDGGEGTGDVASYAGSFDSNRDRKGVTVDLSTGDGSGDDAEDDILSGIEHLEGSGYADRLVGDSEANTLTGLEGNDELDGGEGSDTLIGGLGLDSYLFEKGDGQDIIEGDTDNGKLIFENIAAYESAKYLVFSRENDDVKITIRERDSNDVLITTENSDSVTIEKDAYADGRYTLYGSYDEKIGKLFVGTDQDDPTFEGTNSKDLLVGLGGADTVSYENSNKGVNIDLDSGYNYGGYVKDDVLIDIENIIGTSSKDTLQGNDEKNEFTGGGGDDSLYGRLGDDILKGGAGKDKLYGGDGSDTLSGGGGADEYYFEEDGGNDFIQDDTDGGKLIFGNIYSIDELLFNRESNGDVKIKVDDSNSVTIRQASYANGRYTISEGYGYSSGAKLYLGTDDIVDVFTGSDKSDLLLGLGDNDNLKGGLGGDFLFGGTGDDTLEGGASYDTLDGGEGTDTASYKGSLDTDRDRKGVTVNLEDGWGDGDDAEDDVLRNIENLIGSKFDDKLTGNDEENKLTGGAGADVLKGGKGDDILSGGAGADEYYFESLGGQDTIEGDADGGKLFFQSATKKDLLIFDRESNGDVKITIGERDSNDVLISTEDSDSVTIKQSAYDEGHYTIFLGDSYYTKIGKLYFGTNEQDSFTGSGATDWMVGLAGDDTFKGGEGEDIFDGGEGSDTANYEEYESRYGLQIDLSTGDFTGGNDEKNELISIENIIGTARADTLKGNDEENKFTGGAGDDILDGGKGNDILIGGAGADTYIFESLSGQDTIKGDADGGNLFFRAVTTKDLLIFSSESNGDVKITIGERDSNDVLISTEDSDSVTIKQSAYPNARYTAFIERDGGDMKIGKLYFGTGQGNTLTGSRDADWMVGLAGDDTFIGGGGGADIFNGGEGADTVNYGTYKHSIQIDLSDSSVSGAGSEILMSIENIIGTAKGDILTGNDEANKLVGGGGVDILYGGEGEDTLEGGEGVDRLYGGEGEDTLEGGESVDTLEGEEDDDILEGGVGDDSYIFGAGDGQDTIQGDTDGGRLYFRGVEEEGGSDLLLFNRESDGDVKITIGERDSNGVVTTTEDSDSVTIKQSAYADARYTIFYSSENEKIGRLSVGESGGGTLRAAEDNEKDWIVGSDADDIFYGDEGADTLEGRGGRDELYGEEGSDILKGGEGNDILYGAEGNDTLKGGGGDDQLYGGKGIDTLEGGIGNDEYVFEKGGGHDILQGDADGGKLFFRDATGRNDFIVTREGEDVEIAVGSDSVTIRQDAYANGRYTLFYGPHDTEVSALYLGTNENDNGDTALTDSGGNDWMLGLAGEDTLEGGIGDDILDGGGGNDILDGGVGADSYIFGKEHGTDTIQGDLEEGNQIFFQGTDALSSISVTEVSEGVMIASSPTDSVTILSSSFVGGRYTIFYGEDNIKIGKLYLATNRDGEVLTSLEGQNWIVALEGDDTIKGSAGADIFDGGEGKDTVSYAESLDTDGDNLGVRIDLSTQENSGDDAEGDRLLRVENLIGTERDDSLTGNDQDNNLEGGTGDDTLEGGAGADLLDGGEGTGDTASYAGSLDTDGDGLGVRIDLSTGSALGDDAGSGGVQSDTFVSIENLIGTERNDILTGNDEDNKLIGGAGVDTLYGGVGEDTLLGGAGADILYGGVDADIFNGGLGVDLYRFALGDGDDIIQGDADGGNLYFRSVADADDFIITFEGEDVKIAVGGDSVTIKKNAYADGHYTIFYGADDTEFGRLYLGTDEKDTIAFGSDEEEGLIRMLGFGGDDTLKGSAGKDVLEGGLGIDTLDGGAGADILEGGEGRDTYVFQGSFGEDTIQGDADGGMLEFVPEESAEGTYKISDYPDSIKEILTSSPHDVPISVFRSSDDVYISVTDLTSGVTIKDTAGEDDAYEHGRYIISYQRNLLYELEGVEESFYELRGTKTILGRLSLAAEGGETIRAADDDEKDWMIGSDNQDELYGNGGDDIIQAGGGADTLEGGRGDDILLGGAGIDTYVINEGDGSDIIVDVGVGNMLYFHSGGPFLLDSLSFSQQGTDLKITIGGDGGDEILIVDYYDRSEEFFSFYYEENGAYIKLENDDIIDELKYGKDLTIRNRGTQNRDGTLSDDIINGSNKANTINGLAGEDTIDGWNGNDILDGGLGDDTISGGLGRDTLKGDAGNDLLMGDAGNDKLYGGEGDDELLGGGNHDTLRGEAGTDYLKGEAGNDKLYGGDGSDELYGGLGNDELRGGDGDDILSGGEGVDKLYGNAGNDYLFVEDGEGNRGGIDILDGGADDDIIVGSSSDDENLKGNTGDDIIYGKEGDDKLFGDEGKDVLYGGFGTDVLYGGDGDDILDAGGGAGYRDAETLNGGEGNDLLYASDSSDKFIGGEGSDTVSYDKAGEGEDSLLVDFSVIVDLLAPEENQGDYAEGDTYDSIENIIGTDYADILKGNDGANKIEGGDGNDIIHGRGGADQLFGGEGADSYVFNVAGGSDTIIDDPMEGGEFLFLIFENTEETIYSKEDFDSSVFSRNDNDLVISLDKNSGDAITDEVTIQNAYAEDGGMAYSISISFGEEKRFRSYTELNEDYWSSLT